MVKIVVKIPSNQSPIMVKITKNTIRKIPINQDRIMVKIMLKIFFIFLFQEYRT